MSNTRDVVAEPYIDIVFDGPPSHESGRFVEVEDATGASINLGEWVDCGDLWRLRIPDPRALVERVTQAKKEVEDEQKATRSTYRAGYEHGLAAEREAHAATKTERDRLQRRWDEFMDWIQEYPRLSGWLTQVKAKKLEAPDA
jgi:hypothetical protein